MSVSQHVYEVLRAVRKHECDLHSTDIVPPLVSAAG